ncbi:MAG: ATP-binding cassette domain-containing protein [Burkholderiales bacterium]|nr:MAG: ATP-binding cassette domain-containing protein [Burkholderiales bacterium]
MLRIDGLHKRFGDETAVDRLSLHVDRGECYGLLGPNGAGKSTTLRAVLGLTPADGGSIALLGHSIPDEARVARHRVGVVPQADMLDPDFTVTENLLVFGRYFGLSREMLRRRIDPLLEFAGLAHRRDARIGELSGGMRRRLTLARALINEPEVLFLDEPTTGLDPQARHLIWEWLQRLLARGTTIVLTTHFMEEAERLCDRLSIIDRGRKIAEDSPARLVKREIEPHVLEVRGPAARHWLLGAAQPLCSRTEWVGETAFGYCSEPHAALASLERLDGVQVLHRRANLEDVFLKLTGRELRD